MNFNIMRDSLLNNKQKQRIIGLIAKENWTGLIKILDSVKTVHASTAKMKDKRFTIAEIAKYILDKHKNKTDSQKEKQFFSAGKEICNIRSDNAKEIGVHIIWRGYNYSKKAVEALLLQISDDPNWEVREYAAGAVSSTLKMHGEFYKTLEKWRKHKSVNIRRAVV